MAGPTGARRDGWASSRYNGAMSTPSAPRRRPVGIVVLAVVVILLLVVLAGLLIHRATTGTSTGSTTTSAPATTSAGARPTSSTSARPTTSAGCPATPGVTTPAGADVREVVDVDGDGRPDQAWLTGGEDRRFGITTASGATFSIAIESASPLPAAAVVGVVQGDQPIALIDLWREALVYSLDGCAVTAPTNAQGTPYTFDRGFGDVGTGVGCSQDGAVLRLAGLDAVQAADSTFTVTRTWVDLSKDGRKATNGAKSTVATGAAGTEAVVTTAQEVTCGDAVAGKDGPVEPQ